MRGRALCLFGMLSLLGCGGDDSGGAGKGGGVSLGDAAVNSRTCTDEDGDYFGRYCQDGPDCDDTDPLITDECRRCIRPNENCPCEPGSEPMSCKPDDIVTTLNGVAGRLVCAEGARYCRSGVYTKCEALVDYNFVAD